MICPGTDITEERRAQERLRVLANTDLITGLPNRNAIQDKINHAIATRSEESFGLMYPISTTSKGQRRLRPYVRRIGCWSKSRWRSSDARSPDQVLAARRR